MKVNHIKASSFQMSRVNLKWQPGLLAGFLLILFLFIDFSILSAQQHDDAICISGGKRELDYRKKPWKGNNNFLDDYLKQINYFADAEKTRYLVPLKFWVYRDNSGNGGASLADLKVFMDDLNMQ
jgi:hypothetical protein